jgi:peptide/nickel transport system permease protein
MIRNKRYGPAVTGPLRPCFSRVTRLAPDEAIKVVADAYANVGVMLRYLGNRLLGYSVLLYAATSLTYLLAATQLNPRSQFELQQPPVPEQVVSAQLLKYNLSDQVPLIQRYGNWLLGVVHGDWGYSPLGASVNAQIADRMWVSLRLVVIGTLAGLLVGVLAGAWAATRQHRLSDRATAVLSLFVVSTPVFVIAQASQQAATTINDAAGLRIFEFVGESGGSASSGWAQVADRLQHLVLPTAILIVVGAASISLIQRNLMLDALSAEYVRTARAKGLSRRRAALKHALRTSVIPISTYVAMSVATMFVGSVFIERLFAFDGIGQYAVEAISTQDVNAVVAVTAFAGACVLVGALLSDVLAAVLDPRVRLK